MKRRLTNITLRGKMIVGLLLVAIFSLGTVAFIYTGTTRTALTAEAYQTLYAAASRTAVSIDAFINHNFDAIRTEAMLPDIVTYMNLSPEQRQGSDEEKMVTATLETLHKKDLAHISSYAILDNLGTNLVDTNVPEIGQDESMDDCFQQPYQNGLPYMSSVQFASAIGDVYFCFSSPIRNDLGQIAGVLRARYNIAVLQNLVSESQGLAGDDSFAILLDDNYLYLAHDTIPELIFRTITPIDEEKIATLRANGRIPNLPSEELLTDVPSFQEGLENAANQSFFTANTFVGTTAVNEMAVVKLSNKPWFVVYAQPQETFLVPIEDAIRTTLILALIITCLVIITALFMIRWLANPVTRLTAVAQQIAAGDLTARAQVKSNDEIGQLAYTFNIMTTRLQQTLDGLEKRNIQLQDEIAERKRTEIELHQAKEAAETANQAKSFFLASMSHELRTPLNGILGYAQILRRDSSLTGSQQNRINIIQQSGEHLLLLINDLFDLSQIELEGLELQHNPFHFPTLLQNINDTIQMLVQEKNLAFCFETVDFNVGQPALCLLTSVYGDHRRLQQVLMNLLDNAIKFTPSGEVRFKVGPTGSTPSNCRENKQRIRFQVEDTGIGIPTEEVSNIFEPFQPTKKRRKEEGTGLGLAISHRLVKMMGGELLVDSRLGEGSTFWFDLDLVPVQDWSNAGAEEKKTIIGYVGERRTILIVDDMPEIRYLLVDVLSPLDFICVEAENGRDALKKADAIQPDVILSDLTMPVMDGYELARQLHQSKTLNGVLLLAVTAGVSEAQQQKCLDAGYEGFVTKPIMTEDLLGQLEAGLQLQWIYREDGARMEHNWEDTAVYQTQPIIDNTPMITPPPENLAIMYQLASIGDVEAVIDMAVRFKQQDDAYDLFATHIENLAHNFQITNICSFLQQHLERTRKYD